MSGRFRFTPACCCGGEEPGPEPDCLTLCIPDCQEIYSGLPTTSYHLRDDIPLVTYDDFSFAPLNLLSSYYNMSDCSYFDVYLGNDGEHYAAFSAVKTYDSHVIGSVLSTLMSPISIPGCFGVASTDSGFYSIVSAGRSSAPHAHVPYCDLSQRSYDSLYHSRNGVQISFLRVFCLPFAEPFCLHEDTPTQLSPQEDVKDYYVPLEGTGEEGCYFTWPTSCSFVVDADRSELFSAKKLSSEIARTVSNTKDQALDFYVIRLFGWSPPVLGSNTVSIDTAESAEFAMTYGIRANSVMVPLITHDISTASVSLTDSEFDPDYNKTGHPDYPAELLRFSGTASPITASRIIFGSSDTSATDGSLNPGSADVWPTRWKTPRSTTLPHADNNDNSSRFNGIYWVYAGMSRCGEAFPQTVTHGVIPKVPVGFFDVDIDNWNSSTYFLERQGGGAASSAPMTLTRAADSFTYSDLHQGITNPNRQGVMYDWYLDESVGVGNNRIPYLVKPAGKHLIRLLWRVFLDPLAVIGKNQRPPASDSDLEPAFMNTSAVSFGDPTAGLPAAYAGWKANAGTLIRVHPYNATDVPYIPNIGDYVPGNIYTDADGYVTDYGYSKGINWCEASVNGDRYLTFGPNDDPAGTLTDTLYFPAIDRDKLSQLLGGTLNLRVIDHAMNASMIRSIYSSMTFVPQFDFSYIAVWKDD